MVSSLRRIAASSPLRARFTRAFAATIFSLFTASASRAVTVHGRVTDALGRPVSGAHLELVANGTVVASGSAADDGSFEVSTGQGGRFKLLTSAAGFVPPLPQEFYGRARDLLTRSVVLATGTVRQEVSVTASGIPTPVPQLTVPVSMISGQDLATRIGILEELRQVPGFSVVQTGQTGSQTSLFVRGGQSDANKVLIDGIPAEDVGGRFDFGTVSSTGVAGLELYRGPDSALYGSNALASVVSLTTPRGSSSKPVLEYSGDAGNLHTWRNEAALSGAYRKLDYYGAFSRFDTSNAVQNDRYHSSTAAANLGYNLFERTTLRGTVRHAVSATGVPNAHDFFGISANQKQADQNTYAQGTLDNRTAGDWHNMVRYGVARKREQFTTFGAVGTPVVSLAGTPYAYTTWYGKAVTIRGANGYAATGASPIAYSDSRADYLLVSNRDQLYYQSDKAFTPHITALFGFRYENERGAYRYPLYGTNQNLQRTNFEYTGQVQGDIRNRVFYSLGGAVEKNHLFGLRGTPRLGLAWAAVRPSEQFMHGTKLRFNVSRGVQEPNLNTEFGSLYGFLRTAGNTAAITAYGVTPPKAQEARTYDYGIDQNILGSKLLLKVGYFHSQFDHQIEYVTSSAMSQYFGITGSIPNFYGAYVNSLTYRAQGMESEVEWQPTGHIFVRGGYTYLATLVQRSFSSDALRVAGSTTNPAFPGITIGSSSPLAGNRMFRRAPNTGFLSAQYTRPRYTVAFRGAFAGRSDDSTYLSSALLLPNRDLDFGYAKLDLSGTYAVMSHVRVFTQLENLLNNQHIGPIGYPGLPLTVRAGLKIRLGGE